MIRTLFILATAFLSMSALAETPSYGVCIIMDDSQEVDPQSGRQLAPERLSHLVSPYPSWLQKKLDESELSPTDIDKIDAMNNDFIFEIANKPKNGKIFDLSYEEGGRKFSNIQYAPNSGFTGIDRVDINLTGISKSKSNLKLNLKYYIHVLSGAQKLAFHKIVSDESKRSVQRYSRFSEEICGVGHSNYWKISSSKDQNQKSNKSSQPTR